MAQSDLPRVSFEKFTLPNGLQVILHVDRKLPVVHVNHWFHVGSKVERPGRTGFAHLFEHLMFEGSKHAPEGYFKYIEQAGGNLREGGVNGTTSNDRTNYFATVPSGNLEYVLWLESDRVATLADALTRENFENQREVVRNERRQTTENQPYGRWYELVNEHLYPAGHPYSWPVIGRHEDLEAAGVDEVAEFFRTYYTPNNLSLVIAGDFDKDFARDRVAHYYGALETGPLLERQRRWVPALAEGKIVEVTDRVPQARVHMIWPAPQRFEVEETAIDAAAAVLGDGLSSRLEKLLVYDRRLCTEVSVFNYAREIAGLFGVVATVRPDCDVREVEDLVNGQIARLASGGPTRDEVERARTVWEYQYVSSLERIGGFGGKADRLNESNTYKNDPGYFHVEHDRFRNLSGSKIAEAVKRWLVSRHGLTLRYFPDTLPKAVAGAAPDSVLDRSVVPALGSDTPFQTPEVHEDRLDNGLEVLVVEHHDLPKVAVSLNVKSGGVHDPPDRCGMSQLMLQTMDKGTRGYGALDLDEALSRLGTVIGKTMYLESARIGMDVLTDKLSAAMALFADVARNPLFPEEELERERHRHLDHLKQQASHPQSLAQRLCPGLVFGEDHPYGRPVQGYASSVAEMSRYEIARAYEENWRPDQSALVFVGDISRDQALKLADQRFGSWKGDVRPAKEVPDPSPDRKSNRIYLVDRPGAPQTVVCQFIEAPSRDTPDYHALRLVDAIWGGGFQSRLNQNLREEKGYTYGVSTSLGLLGVSGYWKVQTSIQADKTGEVVMELMSEMAGLGGERPVGEEELEEARTGRIRGYAQRFESLRRIAGSIGALWSSERPMSDMRDAVENLQSVRLEEVRSAARKYLDARRAGYLLVGDGSSIETQLADRGLPVPEVLDPDAQPAARAPASAEVPEAADPDTL
ncbi:MAG: pitrilysin family protein [candidate division Zixibacteria bacterium]|nr:pitrilysin family protein [candidate division Zixibacteria bacterium]